MQELSDAQKRALELKKIRSVEVQKTTVQTSLPENEKLDDGNKLILAKLNSMQKQLDELSQSSQNDPLNLGLIVLAQTWSDTHQF